MLDRHYQAHVYLNNMSSCLNSMERACLPLATRSIKQQRWHETSYITVRNGRQCTALQYKKAEHSQPLVRLVARAIRTVHVR